ncbi:ribonuclease pancreatic-like [Sphaerodactylus townsendi]|uniref:ribonuclease pancreatic-like n=1 Tax=Sphaerodactylus townsendi TaxID=933632 RepID=UPI00202706FA|nr:ribonuclease pancreatic-like [Sphaerodactylus townsendi]
MALKELLLALLLLCSILFLVSLVDGNQHNYETFLRQHVDPRRMSTNPSSYCQWKMRVQGLTSSSCKKRNAFIHARPSHLKLVCGAGGMNMNRTISDSQADFTVTNCYSKGGSPPRRCRDTEAELSGGGSA